MSLKRTVIYLERDQAKRLHEFAALRGLSMSKVAGAAVSSTLSLDGADQREAAISCRLDRLSRQLDKVEQDQNIAIETFALFIRYYLSVTPVIPEPQQPVAWAPGRVRFAKFVKELSRQLQRGRSLVREIHEEIYPEERDFFTTDPSATAGGAEVDA